VSRSARRSRRLRRALIEATLLEFDGLEAQLNSLVAIGELLRGSNGTADLQ
jgi:hypothetical protein